MEKNKEREIGSEKVVFIYIFIYLLSLFLFIIFFLKNKRSPQITLFGVGISGVEEKGWEGK